MNVRGNGDKLLKIVMLGGSGVGKTSLTHKLKSGVFPEATKKSYGTDFKTYSHLIPGQDITIELWDTAGDVRFLNMGDAFYKRSDAFIIFVDVNSESQWGQNIEPFLEKCHLDSITPPIFFVPMKADLLTHESYAALKKKIEKHCANDGNNATLLEPISVKDLPYHELSTWFVEKIISQIPSAGLRAPLDKFHAQHQLLKKEEVKSFPWWRFAFMTKSNITPESDHIDILLVARHSETNVSRKVCIQLGWLNKDGSVDERAPKEVKAAYSSIVDNGLTFKRK